MIAPATESTALTVVQRASLALGAAEHEKRLIELAKASTDLVEIRDSASYQQVHGARMACKRARLEIEGLGEGAREDARNFAKAVIAEQKRLVSIVEPEELRLQALQKAHDDRLEAEKEAKRQAEQNRIAMIKSAMDDIRLILINATGKSAAVHAEAMDELERFQIDPARFAEFAPDAEQLKVATMNKLAQLHAAKEQLEEEAKAEAERLAAEQARIKAEREELERQKADQAAREKAENDRFEAARKKQEADEAQAKVQRDAEEAASKARIEAQEREAREARAKADKEALDARIAEEQRLRSIREAEEKRIVAEREKLTKERIAAEERERNKQAAIEAKARAKREKEEAAERARLAKLQEKMDARQMLESWLERFGHLTEYQRTIDAAQTNLADLAAQKETT